jgi:hypothetical protein
MKRRRKGREREEGVHLYFFSSSFYYYFFHPLKERKQNLHSYKSLLHCQLSSSSEKEHRKRRGKEIALRALHDDVIYRANINARGKEGQKNH